MPLESDANIGWNDRPSALPDTLVRKLTELRRRVLWVRLLRGCGGFLAVSCIGFGAALLLDRFLLLSAAARQVLTGTTVFLAAGSLLLSCGRLLRSIDTIDLARALEAGVEQPDEGLLSTVEIAGDPREGIQRFSPALLEGMAADAARRAAGVRAADIVQGRSAHRAVLAGVVAVVLLGVGCAVDPGGFRLLALRFLQPGQELPRPSTVRLSVIPGDGVTAIGEDVEVRVRVERGVVERISLRLWEDGEAPADMRVLERSAEDGEAVFVLPGVQTDFHYRAVAGDFVGPVFKIRARPPPHSREFTARYIFPEYTRWLPREATATHGNLEALKGSRSELTVEAGEPLDGAWIEIDAQSGPGRKGARVDASNPANGAIEMRIQGAAATAAIVIDRPTSYRLYLKGLDGVTNGGRERYTLRPIPDQQPQIELMEPEGSEIVVEPRSLLRLRYRVEDDVGVAALKLVWESNQERSNALQLAPDRSAFDLDIGALDLAPGEGRPFVLEATDRLGQSARTPVRTLRIATLPSPPEGPGWLSDLRGLHGEATRLRDEWVALLPSTRETESPEIHLDRARQETLKEIDERAAALQGPLLRAGEAFTKRAREIPVPTLSQVVLHDIGVRLRALSFLELEDMRGSLEDILLQATRDQAASAPKEVVRIDASGLYQSDRAIEGALQAVAEMSEAILEEEELEELKERMLALQGDVAVVRTVLRESRVLVTETSATVFERCGDLVHEAISIAAAITRMAEDHGGASEAFGVLARRSLRQIVAPLERARSLLQPRERDASADAAAERALAEAESGAKDGGSRLEGLHGRARKGWQPAVLLGAREKRIRESLEACSRSLSSIGDPEGLTLFLRQIDRAVLHLSEDVACLEEQSYGDFQAVFELSACRDLLLRLRDEVSALSSPAAQKLQKESSPGDESQLTSSVRSVFLKDILGAAEKTRLARHCGRSIAGMTPIAAGFEKLVHELERSRQWNPRQRRFVLRKLEDMSFLLEAVQGFLWKTETWDGDAGHALKDALQSLCDAELNAAIEGARAVLRLLRGDIPSGSPAFPPLVDELRLASGLLDRVVSVLEEFRLSAFPEAAEARAWLREQLGSLQDRISRLARLQEAHASSVRASAEATSTDEQPPAPKDLAVSEDSLRGAAAQLALGLRRQATSLFATGRSAKIAHAHDLAAGRLSGLASREMSQAVVQLEAAHGATGARRQDLLLTCAALELSVSASLGRIAEDLVQLNDAVSALENLDFAVETASELDRSLESSPLGAQTEHTAEELAILVQTLLDGVGRAHAVLSRRWAEEESAAPIVQLLADAKSRLRAALAALERKDLPVARELYAAGHGSVSTALELLRALESSLAATAGELEGSLAEPVQAQPEDTTKAGLAEREKEETTAELARLRQFLEAEREIDSLISDLLDGSTSTEEAVNELKQKTEAMAEELDQLYSVDELVQLVARLGSLIERGEALERKERILAGRALAVRDAVATKELGEAHRTVQEEATRLSSEFHRLGLELSASLPRLLRSYWRAENAAQSAQQALGEAHDAFSFEDTLEREQASESLLECAFQIGLFVSALRQVRQEALLALTQLEMGESGSDSPFVGVEKAQRSVSEAIELQRQGEFRKARQAHRAAARSLRQATTRLSARLQQRLATVGNSSRLSPGQEGLLQEAWRVLTRDALPPGAERLGRDTETALAYPVAYRELVKRYARALGLTWK